MERSLNSSVCMVHLGSNRRNHRCTWDLSPHTCLPRLLLQPARLLFVAIAVTQKPSALHVLLSDVDLCPIFTPKHLLADL